jgi:hypothetical protein
MNHTVYSVKVRNKGHKSQYYTLRIMRLAQEDEIHTSNSLAYLMGLVPVGAQNLKNND